MGKSAMFPFSNWLPLAMEGPTPSSAVFYGAISIHFGPFLLLRSSDLIASSGALSYTVISIGLITAILSYIISHHQNDIKSMLSYSSISQVGLIVAEIGFGLNIIALIHILGHSSFRTLQILRAPSLIHDLNKVEQLLGHSAKRMPEKSSKIAFLFYQISFERFFMDKILKDLIIANILKPFHKINQLEQKFSNYILNKHDK